MTRKRLSRRPPRPKALEQAFCDYVEGIIDAVHEHLVLLDSELRVISASRSFYRTFKLRREDTEGKVLYDVASRRFDVPKLRGLLGKILEKRNPVERSGVKRPFTLAEGQTLRAAARRLKSSKNEAQVILLALEDITDLARTKEQLVKEIKSRRWTNEELREREEQFHTLVETMNEGLAMRDEDGRFSYVNGKLADMLGYTRDEMSGRFVTDFLDEANRAILEEQVIRRQRGEQAPYDLTWTRKDGRKVYTIMSPKPIFDSAQRFKGAFAVITNITDRKATEAALRESERKLRLLSSYLLNTREREGERIARELHDELGQDLAVLKYQARFIENSLRKDQKALREACSDAMQHLEAMMENVRRISRDLSPSILESLGLTASLRRLAEDHAKHNEAAVDLDLDIIDNMLPQEGEVNVYRILQEALTNVTKHAGATQVSIAVTKLDDGIYLRVTDDGKGFDILDGTSSESELRGLGLTIMEERARMIKASLEIKSFVGAGTEILLRVPVGMKGRA